MNDYAFNKEYITSIKKNIINYLSRTNININKITFNLSLYTQFVISDTNNTTIKVTLPRIKKADITPAKVEIGRGYFNVIKNITYVKEEYEDELTTKITEILIRGAAIKVKYDNMMPISIEGIGFETTDGNGFDTAFASVIAEDINEYGIPHFTDPYAFNNSIVRMILAIAGYKQGINTYFNHDKSLLVSLYSLSVDSTIFSKINRRLTLIKHLVNTQRSKDATITDTESKILEKLIHAKKAELLYMIIDKLYIPYINHSHLDKRKLVRDEILKGFLGINYTNLKLTKENKDSYYWASLVNNTISINNKITDQAWSYFRGQILTENEKNMDEIYSKYALTKAKNNAKEFWLMVDKDGMYIDTGKKIIKERKLVLEMLSYAYITSIDSDLKDKIEAGIVKLCSNNDTFTSRLSSNPLSSKMLTAAIIQLASKNGYDIELTGIENNVASFKIKNHI